MKLFLIRPDTQASRAMQNEYASRYMSRANDFVTLYSREGFLKSCRPVPPNPKKSCRILPAPHKKFPALGNPGRKGGRIPPGPDTANQNHQSNLNTNLPFSMDKGKHVPEFLHEGGTETEAPWCRTKSGGPVREVFLCLHDHHVRPVGTVF